MLAQSQHLAAHLRHNLALVLGPTMLQDMLDDVVSVLILQGIMREDWEGGGHREVTQGDWIQSNKQTQNFISYVTTPELLSSLTECGLLHHFQIWK